MALRRAGRYVYGRMPGQPHRRVAWVVLSSLIACLIGCGGCNDETQPPHGADGGSAGAPGDERAVALIDELPSCDIDHRGLLLDLGSGELLGRVAHSLEVPRGIILSEHDGASWARMFDRSLSLTFYLPYVAPVFVQLRAIGRDASQVTLSIDGYALGTEKIGRNEPTVVTTRTSSQPLDAGLHTLNIRFRGTKRADAEPFAELDWVRIGSPDEIKRTYGAPTMLDVLAPSAQLGGVPHRAISLRAPGVVRCTVRVPSSGKLRTAVGMRGDGNATAAIVARRDGEEAAVLRRVDVNGGPDAAWTDVEVDLSELASQVVTLELEALKTTGTGRLLFGDPMLILPPRAEVTTPRARAAIVVMMSGIVKEDLPPWRETETPHLPTFNQLAKTSAIFRDHRAPSTLVAATVASLLVGASPRAHALLDAGARLPGELRTIAAMARESSVRAAMFTAVPTTSGAFGFERHWDTFNVYPPNVGTTAATLMDDAAKWIGDDKPDDAEERPVLAVLHARGGHPPWEVTPDEASKLPPAEYTGYFGPRRAAQVLGKLQGRHSRLAPEDAERMRALFHAGLSREDEALGRLVRHLEGSGRWDSTLLIVAGDVASSRSRLFQDGLPIEERLLSAPLYVHFPGGAYAGQTVDQPTEVYDITHTLLRALGIKKPAEMHGRDLAAMAAGGHDDVQRVRVAVLDKQYSARWGEFVLHGEVGERPSLCKLDVDPTCGYDRRDDYPLVAQALFRRLAKFEHGRTAPTREPLELDSESAAMLSVWGAY